MQGPSGAGHVLLGKRRWLQEDFREMSEQGFRRHAREESDQRGELAIAGLDGSAVGGGHGWVDVRIIAYDAGKKSKGVGAVCWVRALHEEQGFVQGPVRTSEATVDSSWKERFRFGLGRDLVPSTLIFDVVEGSNQKKSFPLKVPLTWFNMDRPEGEGPDAPHVVFEDRAVRVEARTARDIERWFDLGSGRRISMQLCYRSDTSLPLEWTVDNAPENSAAFLPQRDAHRASLQSPFVSKNSAPTPENALYDYREQILNAPVAPSQVHKALTA